MTRVDLPAERPRRPAAIRFAAGDGGWTYVWDHRRKPHVHPVATPSGRVLSLVEPPDHPWQRGLWFVVKFVDGDNFWEEGDPQGWGVQRHSERPVVQDGTIDGDLVWIRPDRTTVAVRERRRLGHVELDDDAYAIDWDVTLGADQDVFLDRSPHDGVWGGYSGLAFRGRADWRDTRLLLDDGLTRERVAPRPSRWCDLSGRVDGGAAGLCVLDHPDNPSHPVPFYAAALAGPGYGAGWANSVYPAFLWHHGRRLAADEHLRLRYRVIVHDGLWDHGRASAAWESYAGSTQG